MNQRNITLDALKGYGIILVVIGHLQTIYSGPIYRFHMALFFVISGWCFSKRYTDNVISFIWKRFCKILLPALLLVAFCKLLVLINPEFWTSGIDKYYFLGTKWFLYDLFKSSVVMVGALYVSNKFFPVIEKYWALVFLGLAYVTSYMHYDSIAIVFWISSFVAFGYYLRTFHSCILERLGGVKLA